MKNLKDKVVIVTGGGQGIGKGIARCLLEQEACVVIAEADEEAGNETVSEYEQIGEILFVSTDVSQEEAVRKMAARTVQRYGRIDALVNNAGIAAPENGPVEELSLETWNRVIGVNLTGCFLCAKHTVPFLRKTGGAIVNIASTRAFQSEPDSEAYTATKGGIVALTHALAISLGPDIRVNCISPGWIAVDEWKKRSERTTAELRPADHAQHPAGRVGRPEDIAALTVYLLSEDASFVTGQNFTVDGGMTRKMIYVA